MRSAWLLVAGLLTAAVPAHAQQIRDHLEVVTSAAAFGLAAEVSEAYAEHFRQQPPKVIRSGSGAAIATFCGGLGSRFPDVALTSRRMSDSERARCRNNGIRQIVRAKIGYEAYAVLAHRDFPIDNLSRVALYGAVGQFVADGASLVPNTRTSWDDVASHMPSEPINVFVPSASAPSWEAFVNLVIRPGCQKVPAMQRLEINERLRTCARVRTDGRLGRYRASDPDLPDMLCNQPKALAVVDLANHQRFAPAMQPIKIDGAAPTVAAISQGRYTAAQPLYAYVKAQHYDHVPGFLYYVDELTSKRALGRDGYLRDAGVTPLTEAEWQKQRSMAISMIPISLTDTE